MNTDRPGRRRIRHLATIGLLALVTGALVVPSLANAAPAADTTPPASPTAPTSWVQTLRLEQPDARLTLAEVRRMSEAASHQRLGPVGAVLVVSGNDRDLTSANIDRLLTGSDVASLRLLWRSAGSTPGTTLDQLTVGVVPGQQSNGGIGTCNQCNVTINNYNSPPPTTSAPAPSQGGGGVETCDRCTVVIININITINL
jgi:hypothetical protein